MNTGPQPQAVPVPVTMPFSVTLQAQQWNMVIAALDEAPHKVAAPLIQAISQQLQQAAAEYQAAEHQGQTANGLDAGGVPQTH